MMMIESPIPRLRSRYGRSQEESGPAFGELLPAAAPAPRSRPIATTFTRYSAACGCKWLPVIALRHRANRVGNACEKLSPPSSLQKTAPSMCRRGRGYSRPARRQRSSPRYCIARFPGMPVVRLLPMRAGASRLRKIVVPASCFCRQIPGWTRAPDMVTPSFRPAIAPCAVRDRRCRKSSPVMRSQCRPASVLR